MNEFCANRIMALATRIKKGYCSKLEAKLIYEFLKIINSGIDVPYDVEDKLTEEYMLELYETVKMGVCSESIILHMADIAESLYRKSIVIYFLLRLGSTLVVVGGIIWWMCSRK